jgi:hypothetical protein
VSASPELFEAVKSPRVPFGPFWYAAFGCFMGGIVALCFGKRDAVVGLVIMGNVFNFFNWRRNKMKVASTRPQERTD